MLDHSAIYKSGKLIHWHHRARLRAVFEEVARYRDAASVADIGCSTGYITNLLSETCEGHICGFDYLPEMIECARATYPDIEFQRIDLNRDVKWKSRYELVCCFETLEHVGDLPSAVRNIHAALETGGTLIVSVPVETGLWGIAKFCAKALHGYPMDEIKVGRGEYFVALLLRKDISRFRGEAYTWGTHYGFDWRLLESRIAAAMRIERSYTTWATRIIVARKVES